MARLSADRHPVFTCIRDPTLDPGAAWVTWPRREHAARGRDQDVLMSSTAVFPRSPRTLSLTVLSRLPKDPSPPDPSVSRPESCDTFTRDGVTEILNLKPLTAPSAGPFP